MGLMSLTFSQSSIPYEGEDYLTFIKTLLKLPIFLLSKIYVGYTKYLLYDLLNIVKVMHNFLLFVTLLCIIS